MDVCPEANTGEPRADDVGDPTIGFQNLAGQLPTGETRNGNPASRAPTGHPFHMPNDREDWEDAKHRMERSQVTSSGTGRLVSNCP